VHTNLHWFDFLFTSVYLLLYTEYLLMEFGTVWVTVVKLKELITFQRCYISIYLLVISLKNILQTPLLRVI